MAGIFTQITALLSVFQFLVQTNNQGVQVTVELLQQHEVQHRQEMSLVLELLWRNEEQHNREMAQVLEMLHREEQRSQEMALRLEMLQRSQEEPESAQESLWLSACQHWWFWVCAEMLLVLFAAYWLPRHGDPGYDDGSDGAETPPEPGRKRRRRKRKRMQTAVTGWMTSGLRIRVSF